MHAHPDVGLADGLEKAGPYERLVRKVRVRALHATRQEVSSSKRIEPLIHRVYPLEQAADAHRAMEAGEHFGKLVLRVR